MIRAMELKNLSANSQRAYLAAVTGLTRHYQQSPSQITDTMIEDYLLYLKNDKGNAPNSCGSVLTGLRFFYKNVVKKKSVSITAFEKNHENCPPSLPWKKSGSLFVPRITSNIA
jgi:site-specific recombinase XerD